MLIIIDVIIINYYDCVKYNYNVTAYIMDVLKKQIDDFLMTKEDHNYTQAIVQSQLILYRRKYLFTH